MKYETLTSYKSNQTYAPSGTETYTLTFTNNIDSIRCLFFKTGCFNGDWMSITDVSISGNVLTVTATNTYSSSVSGVYSILMATVASY